MNTEKKVNPTAKENQQLRQALERISTLEERVGRAFIGDLAVKIALDALRETQKDLVD